MVNKMKNFKHTKLYGLLLTASIGLFGIVGMAQAGTASSTFQVTATITPVCQINSAGNIAFASYDPVNVNSSTAASSTGTIQVTCTKSTPANIGLDQGLSAVSGSTCDAPARQMKSGVNLLKYGIYQDSANSVVWGCGTSDQKSFTSASGVTPQSFTTYSTIPAGQDVPTGSYADTVTVTVTF